MEESYLDVWSLLPENDMSRATERALLILWSKTAVMGRRSVACVRPACRANGMLLGRRNLQQIEGHIVFHLSVTWHLHLFMYIRSLESQSHLATLGSLTSSPLGHSQNWIPLHQTTFLRPLALQHLDRHIPHSHPPSCNRNPRPPLLQTASPSPTSTSYTPPVCLLGFHPSPLL
jgi:hypothetical protein